jgi:hypothetical protein
MDAPFDVGIRSAASSAADGVAILRAALIGRRIADRIENQPI